MKAGSVGGGIALILIGAIIAFALEFDIGGVNIALIGYLMIAAGAVLAVVGLVTTLTKRKTHSEVHRDPKTGSEVAETEF